MTPSKHNEANQLTIKNYINFLYNKELSFIEELDFELLTFFCSYLVTTPESKYTFSYYNGKVEMFKPFLINFKKKLDNYITIFEHLKKVCNDNTILNIDIYIVFDESIIFYFDQSKSYKLTDNSNISKISSKGVILQFVLEDNLKKTIDFTCKINQRMIDNKYLDQLEKDFLFFTELK